MKTLEDNIADLCDGKAKPATHDIEQLARLLKATLGLITALDARLAKLEKP